MGMLDDAKKLVKSQLGLGGGDTISIKSMEDTPYKAIASNWYKALPYGFKFTTRNNSTFTCYLPISPENIAVTTHFGTNVLATLYGTIEEHSEQRYYDIVISGTTGFAPKHVSPFEGTPNTDNKGNILAVSSDGKTIVTGRKSYKDDPSKVGLDPNLAGGFFQKSLGALNQGLNAFNKAVENFTGVEINSGIAPVTSGYMAFHNMYRFLLAYKKDAAGLNGAKAGTNHPLSFLNYKDNQQYKCAITKFDLIRSASTPQLYNYTIAFRAYDLKDLSDSGIDQTAASRLADLGLDGVSGSLFQKMKQSSNGAKGVMGAMRGGLNVFGG